MGYNLAAVPRVGYAYGASVRAHVVVLGRHLWGIVLEVSAPCETDVHVFGVAVAVKLPDARNRHCLPRRVVERSAEEVGRTLVGVLHPVEFPLALNREKVGRRLAVALQGSVAVLVSEERRMRRETVYVVHRHIVPLGEGRLNSLVRIVGCVDKAGRHTGNGKSQ